MFINPWTWYIYNDKMPSFPPPDDPWDVVKAFLVWAVLSAAFAVGMFYLPSYVRHATDNNWTLHGLTVISLVCVYTWLLIVLIKKVLKYKK